jgi:N6-adenosine-specific RNA methylase IME4
VKAGRIAVGRAASKVRRAQRDASIPPAPPLPDGPFSLILADPPWSSPSPDSGAAPEQHYPTMSIAELKALRLPAADDAVLFLWIVDWAFQGAVELLKAWGFEHKSSIVWVKPSIGPGVWVRHRHETCWIAVKGNPGPPDPEDRCDSVIEAPRGRHSQKPDQSYQLIERMYPHLSKLELFARGQARPGWHCWGNEAEPAETEPAESEAA